MLRGTRGVLAGVLLALALVPCTALAQITTATVSGTVKDTLGGVVPGATVTLISDTRGVTAAETTTDARGSFVIPNVTADTYTVQVTLQGFKTLKASGIAVSPGDRVALTSLVLQVGTLSETVQVRGETPLIQAASGERSFTIPTTSVDNLPISNRNFLSLALAAPGVRADGSMAGVGRIGGGGYANIQMDGISAMDTGRVRAVERHPDPVGDQGRHEPLPRHRLRHRAALTVEREFQVQHPERDADGEVRSARLGLRDWRPDREAGRQQQAVLLLLP
jgi:hypothetical protein